MNRRVSLGAAIAALCSLALVACVERSAPGAEWAQQAAAGEALLDRGLVREAVPMIEEAIAKLEAEHPGGISHGRALIALGRKHWYWQQPDEAVSTWEQALTLIQRHEPRSEDHARVLDLFGLAAIRFDHLQAAEDYFREAYEIRQELSSDPMDHVASFRRIAQIHMVHGEFARAERLLLRAKDLRESLPHETLELSDIYHGLGLIARKRNQRDLAIQWHERALAIRTRLAPDSPKHAGTLRAIAGISIENRDLTPEGLERARQYYQKTIDIWDENQEFFESSAPLTTAIVGLGKVAMSEGNVEEGVSRFENAVAIARDDPTIGRIRLTSFMSRLGGAYQRAGRHEEARETYIEALDLLERIRVGGEEQISLLGNLGRYARLEGEHAASLEYYRRALVVIDETLSRLGGGAEARGALLTRYHPIYLGAIAAHVAADDVPGALDVLERYRARSFLTGIAERDLLSTARSMPHFAERQREIMESYDRIRAQLADDSLSDERRYELVAQEDRLRAEQFELSEGVRKASPRLAAIRYPEPMRAEEIRDLLEDGTLMLSYFVAPRRVALFAVTSDGVEVLERPVGRGALLQRVTRFRHLVLDVDPRSGRSDRAEAELRRLSEELYDLLIGPVEDLVDASARVLLVPDASLNLLPFGALHDPAGRYLIERAPLLTALSGTVYGQLVDERRASRRRTIDRSAELRFAGFANPVLSSEATEFAVDRGAVSRGGASSRGGDSLAPLPHSSEEVRRIAAIFGDDAVAHVGGEATEDRVREVMGQAEILHFATHGIIDEVRPLDSALVFAPSVRRGGTNGLLQAWEVFQQGRIPTDLVVLSACRTGLGSEIGGEGLSGLTRAFQYAGARTVVASLWDVADRSTAELMVRFYEYLRDGDSKADALRSAQLDMIRGELEIRAPDGGRLPTESPYFWAAFQLYGDWR